MLIDPNLKCSKSKEFSHFKQTYLSKQTLENFTQSEGIKQIIIPSIYDDRKTMISKWNVMTTDELIGIDHKMVMFEDTFRKIVRGRTDV